MSEISEITKITDADLEALAKLDTEGFLIAPQEDIDSFKKRVRAAKEALARLDEGLKNADGYEFEGICVLKNENRIEPELISEVGDITDKSYGFRVDWVPGFYTAKSLGPLWGGCAILVPESNIAVFLIRSSFKNKKKWLIYRRDELLSHELCHIVRMPIPDRIFDEHFAYNLSPSWFRRNLGGTFRYEIDALIFLIPLFLLWIAQILQIFLFPKFPVFIFWILALGCPAFLLLRNFSTTAVLQRAVSALRRSGFTKPMAILFRCTATEIREIAKFAKATEELKKYFQKKAASELRWKIILYRFGLKE